MVLIKQCNKSAVAVKVFESFYWLFIILSYFWKHLKKVIFFLPLVLQRSEVNSTYPWWTAKRNATGSCTYFLRWPVKRSLIVKHCALPTTLALSLPRDASESMWWKIETANKCLLPDMAQIHLEQKLASWASVFFRNPESLRVMLPDNKQ